MREAIVNCIVHNDFTREIPPVFEIFSDRIVMSSYGGLIPGQSEEDFFSCSSMPRNRELMRVFKDTGLVEQLGSGMSRILGIYDKSIFKISEHFIKAVFLFEKTTGKASRQKQANKTSEHMNIIRKYLQENGESKTSDIAEYLELSTARTRAIISTMDGLVAAGTTNNRKYRIKL